MNVTAWKLQTPDCGEHLSQRYARTYARLIGSETGKPRRFEAPVGKASIP